MKRLFKLVSLSIFCCAHLAATDSRVNYKVDFESIVPPKGTPVVQIEQITQDMMIQFAKKELPSIIFEFSQGTSIPLNLFMKGNFVSLDVNDSSLIHATFLKKFYVYFSKDQDSFLFSLDKVQWKKPLEFLTGEFSVGLDAQNGSPLMTLGAEINIRK